MRFFELRINNRACLLQVHAAQNGKRMQQTPFFSFLKEKLIKFFVCLFKEKSVMLKSVID